MLQVVGNVLALKRLGALAASLSIGIAVLGGTAASADEQVPQSWTDATTLDFTIPTDVWNLGEWIVWIRPTGPHTGALYRSDENGNVSLVSETLPTDPRIRIAGTKTANAYVVNIAGAKSRQSVSFGWGRDGKLRPENFSARRIPAGGSYSLRNGWLAYSTRERFGSKPYRTVKLKKLGEHHSKLLWKARLGGCDGPSVEDTAILAKKRVVFATYRLDRNCSVADDSYIDVFVASSGKSVAPKRAGTVHNPSGIEEPMEYVDQLSVYDRGRRFALSTYDASTLGDYQALYTSSSAGKLLGTRFESRTQKSFDSALPDAGDNYVRFHSFVTSNGRVGAYTIDPARQCPASTGDAANSPVSASCGFKLLKPGAVKLK